MTSITPIVLPTHRHCERRRRVAIQLRRVCGAHDSYASQTLGAGLLPPAFAGVAMTTVFMLTSTTTP